MEWRDAVARILQHLTVNWLMSTEMEILSLSTWKWLSYFCRANKTVHIGTKCHLWSVWHLGLPGVWRTGLDWWPSSGRTSLLVSGNVYRRINRITHAIAIILMWTDSALECSFSWWSDLVILQQWLRRGGCNINRMWCMYLCRLSLVTVKCVNQ